MAPADIKHLYDNLESFPDLRISLNGAKTIHAHRGIVCSSNVWFRENVKGRTTWVLLTGLSEAEEAIVRYLYGFALPPCDDQTWQFWMALGGLAQKYKEPGVYHEAKQNFIAKAHEANPAVIVLHILNAMQNSGLGIAEEVVDGVRRRHASKLLRFGAYRATLKDNKRLLWLHLDDLIAASDATMDG